MEAGNGKEVEAGGSHLMQREAGKSMASETGQGVPEHGSPPHRIFGEYLGRRFEVQNRRTRGGLCSVFQITITPRPLLVSKLFIHVQSLSGYETPCMGRRIPARPSSSNHFFAELPVVIGDERWPWLRLCRAAGGRERVCRRVVDLWRSKAK